MGGGTSRAAPRTPHLGEGGCKGRTQGADAMGGRKGRVQWADALGGYIQFKMILFASAPYTSTITSAFP